MAEQSSTNRPCGGGSRSSNRLDTGAQKKTKTEHSMPDASTFESERHRRLSAWFAYHKITSPAKKISVVVDVEYLWDAYGIDISVASDIISFFVTHKAELPSPNTVRTMAELYRCAQDKGKVYAALTLHFEKKYPATQRDYSNKLTASDINEVLGKIGEAALDNRLSAYDQGQSRDLPENLEHRMELQKQASKCKTATDGSEKKFLQSSPPYTPLASTASKRSLDSFLSSSPIVGTNSSPPIQQDEQRKKHASEIKRLEALYEYQKEQLDIQKDQAMLELRQKRMEVNEEIKKTDHLYETAFKKLDADKEKAREELDDAYNI